MPDQSLAGRDQQRKLARARVDDLLARLDAAPDREAAARVRDLAGHLARAIDAFHMEAIRFRMFTLERLLASGDWPAEVHDAFADVKARLEAAGFHTRSVPH